MIIGTEKEMDTLVEFPSSHVLNLDQNLQSQENIQDHWTPSETSIGLAQVTGPQQKATSLARIT